MKQALLDADGVLLGHGFTDFSDVVPPGGRIIDMPDEFSSARKTVRWNGSAFEPYTPPKPSAESDREDALAKLDAFVADATPSMAKLKPVLAALRKVL